MKDPVYEIYQKMGTPEPREQRPGCYSLTNKPHPSSWTIYNYEPRTKTLTLVLPLSNHSSSKNLFFCLVSEPYAVNNVRPEGHEVDIPELLPMISPRLIYIRSYILVMGCDVKGRRVGCVCVVQAFSSRGLASYANFEKPGQYENKFKNFGVCVGVLSYPTSIQDSENHRFPHRICVARAIMPINRLSEPKNCKIDCSGIRTHEWLRLGVIMMQVEKEVE